MTEPDKIKEDRAVPLIQQKGFWLSILAPIIAIIYFLQLEQAFLQSINEVVGSAKIERDLYLKPRFDVPRWGDHYIYRVISSAICVSFVTFICGGLTRTHGKLGGILGGVGISLTMGLLILISLRVPSAGVGIGHLVISGIVFISAPIAGAFCGEFGAQVSTENETGFAGIPRYHFLWLWIPLYWYGLALIAPISNFVFGPDSYSFLIHAIRAIPIVIYGAPLIFGIGIMSGEILEVRSGLLRQILGPVVLVGGLLVIGAAQFAILKATS